MYKKKAVFLFSALLVAGIVFAYDNVPSIFHSTIGSDLTIQVDNVSKDEVISILWDNADITPFFQKMEDVSVEDTDDGFLITIKNAPSLDGEFGVQLINGIRINQHIAYSAEINKNIPKRAITDSTRVYGKVYYQSPNCKWYWSSCWVGAPMASVRVTANDSIVGSIEKTVSTNNSGNYDTRRLGFCSKFTVKATYNQLSATISKPAPYYCGDNSYSIDLYVK